MISTETAPLVIVGASLAGLRAAESARSAGFTGKIILIGAEAHIPYDRPPLSKAFLAADGMPEYFSLEDEIRTLLDVDLRLSSVASSVDTTTKTVTVGDEEIGYGTLIVATGAAPRTMPHLPALEGVLTLRTIDDAQDLRRRISTGTRVVIVGAGFIGSEIASSVRSMGGVVVIVEAATIPLVRAVGDVVGEALASLHGRNGVKLMCDVHVTGVIGDVAATAVELKTGEVLPAELVVVGVGAVPATGWLAGSGVHLDPLDGSVVCDEFLRTSAPSVYAAGDLVRWPNGVMDGSMRLENWTNASEQGRAAAKNALFPDQAVPFTTVPYFWSDWYGNRIQFVGAAAADQVEFVSGSPDSDRFVALYRRDDRLIGAATLNEPRQIMKLRRAIAERAPWHDVVSRFQAKSEVAS